jgi:hypothetical protein
LNNKRIIQIRDVVWLGKGYNGWCKDKTPLNVEDNYDDNGYSMEDYMALNLKELQVIQQEYQKNKSKVYREFKQLKNSFIPDATKLFMLLIKEG